MASVDIRLAGGLVTVNPTTLDYLGPDQLVKLSAPSGDLVMSGDECRVLARKLIEAAQQIEQPAVTSEWP
ncbi:hypothetical protein [Cryobacterium psychrophilum]|uniref:Uncharacterized protein n=1 Tax=Cryobacterium psychrophilum TaxID=41988 RepID=A0A4Y8KPM6_9MICO|nr:hypothetical protein [Cryobacterium psychrophilum]TFD80533.1 hypothetical protein E3T53_05525 [Cryobacterium psychrophilum]